jgi:hypothetical protein
LKKSFCTLTGSRLAFHEISRKFAANNAPNSEIYRHQIGGFYKALHLKCKDIVFTMSLSFAKIFPAGGESNGANTGQYSYGRELEKKYGKRLPGIRLEHDNRIYDICQEGEPGETDTF